MASGGNGLLFAQGRGGPGLSSTGSGLRRRHRQQRHWNWAALISGGSAGSELGSHGRAVRLRARSSGEG